MSETLSVHDTGVFKFAPTERLVRILNEILISLTRQYHSRILEGLYSHKLDLQPRSQDLALSFWARTGKRRAPGKEVG